MKNEIIKLLKKKSFYIVTFIFILFCVLTNVVYQTSLDFIDTDEISVEELEVENQELDLTNNDDLLVYVENLTMIRTEELKREYSSNVQEYLIDNFLYSTIYRMYEAQYLLNDEALTEEYSLELNLDLERVREGDYEYFLNGRIAYLESRVAETSGDEQTRYEELLKLGEYRLLHQIPYDEDNYLHQALAFLEENMVEYINLQNEDSLTEEEEQRLSFLEEEMTLREYVIEQQEDILNETNLRAVLMNFSSEFGIFILIYVIMIAGSIVSEEFSRGTIKSLLTKPFKRRTILTSKLLVVLFSIPVIMIFMSVTEILIGGMILGFDSLSVPVVLYVDGSLKSFSVLSYLSRLLLSGLPMYLVIGVLSFMISTITLSTSAAITVSFLFYLLANVISNLALVYPLPIFKAFVSLYWDFGYLVTASSQPFGASFLTSLFVIFIYLFVMLCLAYVTFIKKDVKNI